MKKITIILFVLIGFCSVAFAAQIKSQVIGKPANKNWVAKIKNISGDDKLIFSEDKGKVFFDIPGMAYTPNIAVWSPDGKYLLMVHKFDIGMNDDPFVKDGIWHHYPQIYDPEKRVLFNAPKTPEAQEILGAGWVKGLSSNILLGFYNTTDTEDGYAFVFDPYRSPDVVKKTTINEWERTSSNADVSPYLYWYSSQIVARLKTGKKISQEEAQMWMKGRDNKEDSFNLAVDSFSGYTYKKGTPIDIEKGDGNSITIYVRDRQGGMDCPLMIYMEAEIDLTGFPVITVIGAGITCDD